MPFYKLTIKIILILFFTQINSPIIKAGILDKANKLIKGESDTSSDANSKENKREISKASPRAHFENFYKLLNDKNFDKAIEYLDLRHVKTSNKKNFGIQLAQKIKFILDRLYWHDPEVLSEKRLGKQNDSLPFYRELLFEIEEDEKTLPFYMDRIRVDDKESRWFVAPPTLSRVDRFYQHIGHGWLGKYLPSFFFEIRILKMQLWQWPFLILLFALTALFSKIMGKWSLRLITTISSRSKASHQKKIVEFFFPPTRLFFALIFLLFIPLLLDLPNSFSNIFMRTFTSLVLFNLIWFLFSIFDFLEFFFTSRIHLTQAKLMYTSLPMGKKVSKVIIAFIALLMIMQNWGINVTALFAGLGIGGIAFAFAGQKTMENIFGGITLIFDRPVRIGDLCQFDGTMGHVEEIGLRSTKIRTLSKTLITVPNAEFCQLKIENIYGRNKIRFYHTIGVRYDTSTDQLRFLLVEIKKLLLSHPRIEEEALRVRLFNLNNYSIDIEINCMVNTLEWNDYLGVREDLLLNIIDLVRESGSDFAYPSQTIFMERGGGLNKVNSKKAEDVVKEWREKQELSLPDFKDEEKKKLWNSMSYPPEGSVLKK
jgi:MscS family membrane protein